MENKRPKISLPMTSINIIAEILSILIMIGTVIIAITSWAKLPQTIPTHFNATGQIDGYGSRTSIFILLPITILMYTGLTILEKFPHVYNYVVEINAVNAKKQYLLARSFIKFLKLEIIMLFSYIEYAIISSALNNKLTLGAWFLPITLLAIFGTLGIYIYKSAKAK